LFWVRIKRIVILGLKSLWLHKLRSILTALGVIFGVSSVIAMLAIGEGASRQAQKQIAELGTRNILISTIKPSRQESASESAEQTVRQYGLTYEDTERIKATIPDVEVVIPVRKLNKPARYRMNEVDVQVIGTVPWFTQTTPIRTLKGRFITLLDMDMKKGVCAIDQQVAKDLFGFDQIINSKLKVGQEYYTVVGVVSPYNPEVSSSDFDLPETSGKGSVSGNVYIPVTTARSKFGELEIHLAGGSRSAEKVELQEIKVKVNSTENVIPVRDALAALLAQSHDQKDYKITVPLELLRQAAETKRIFSIVLGSIAAISLLVGGIGIMNIMLATVSERTREIGIRRALGATKADIVLQFLSETILLTTIGGFAGIAVGIIIPFAVSSATDMPTAITTLSLILAFGISAANGMLFGIYPAYRAANMDPIESLRHE
jgi:putative ABC transport system permease protein